MNTGARPAARAALVPCAAAITSVLTACSEGRPIAPLPYDAGNWDALVQADGAPLPGSFCSLPGSVISTQQGNVVVPGATAATPDLAPWLEVPVGFCAHYFATVKTARQLKFAPGGDLFVASPSRSTTGGANNGINGVVVLPDDDHDGVADSNLVFLDGMTAVQGLMFADGFLYYQDSTTIRRVAFQQGDRTPSASSEMVTPMDQYWPQDLLHWPKVFDKAQDGTIYISNGGSQGDLCDSASAVRGAVVVLNSDGSTTEVAKGFRNPIALRCEANHNVCLIAELALDYSGSAAGREKIVPLRPGDDWGYPCCATKDTPYVGASYMDTHTIPDCSQVAPEEVSFIIGHTPFGLDFETGRWPPPWGGRLFVTLHGVYGSWAGARVVAIALDPRTGLLLPATEFPGGDPANADNMLEFATGWADGRNDHGRPAAIAFAPDGRLFLGDDQAGAVIWIAPMGLMQPAR
jgi:glucose/arabinose dehydrogenase